MPLARLLAIEELRRKEMRRENMQRKILRCASDPFSQRNDTFRYNYRVGKNTFQRILNIIGDDMPQSSISSTLQLATALRFLGIGSFQRAIGKDTDLSMSRQSVGKILWKVLPLLESKLGPRFIQMNRSEEQLMRCKQHFYQKYGIPGMIGCIDGTHIKIMKPGSAEQVYFNRKGYFSIIVMAICDHDLKVLYVDSSKPGATHDSCAWSQSEARAFLQEENDNGSASNWLLGDSGYPLEPFLLTPYRNPTAGTNQHIFNLRHASARNVIERTFGVIKSRFRLLQEILLYSPLKVSCIINVCCAIHNLCREHNDEGFEITTVQEREELDFTPNPHQPETSGIRDDIAASLRRR